MSLITVLPYAAFLTIALVGWLLVDLLTRNNSRAQERLDELRDPRSRARDRADEGGGLGGLFAKAAPKLSKALEPKTELEQSALKVRLANAGYNSPGPRSSSWRSSSRCCWAAGWSA